MNIVKKTSLLVIGLSLVLSFSLPALALAASPATVNLGTAGNFVILAKTGISTTGSTAIVGDIGVSPAAATYITGFALTLPSASAFSTSAQVTGKVYAPSYADPTPANLTAAVLDMQTAYTSAMSRAPDATELGSGNIGGLTFFPGVYKWSSSVNIPANITLSGSAQDVWIFQIAQNLTLSSSVQITLSGGAQASNVFWVVAGQTTIGTGAVFNGNILGQTAIVLNTGARLNGRALAQTAVTLDANMVTTPGASSAPSTVVVTSTTTLAATSTAPSYTSTPTTVVITPVQTQVTSAPTSASVEERVGLEVRLSGLLTTLRLLQIQMFGRQLGEMTSNLRLGSRGSDVTTLQEFLVARNMGPASDALSGVPRSAYFGELTRAALSEFQAGAGISPASGYFGPITRSHIKANY